MRGRTFELVGASKIAIHDARIVTDAQARNGGKKKHFFMGLGEKYDLTQLERIGKPRPSELVTAAVHLTIRVLSYLRLDTSRSRIAAWLAVRAFPVCALTWFSNALS